MRGGAGGLAHDEAAAADSGRRLTLMAHGGAAAGDQQVVEFNRHQHAVGKMIEAARGGNVGPAPHDITGYVVLDRPAVDADAVGKARAGDDIVGRELITASDAASFADAELWRNVDHVGAGKARRLAAQELEEGER